MTRREILVQDLRSLVAAHADRETLDAFDETLSLARTSDPLHECSATELRKKIDKNLGDLHNRLYDADGAIEKAKDAARELARQCGR